MRVLDNKDRIGALLLLTFSVTYLRYAWVLPLDPTATDSSFTARTLPIGLAGMAIFFSLIQLATSLRPRPDSSISDSVRGFRWRPTVLLVSAMAGYALLFEKLGFILGSFLFLLLGFLILGERRLLLSAAVAAGLVGFLWVLLTQAFGLYLDSGDLYRLLIGSES
ncbi:MAG: tripartite tricarboxylate transporter TctB family protein [Pseudomonadota bacterium]